MPLSDTKLRALKPTGKPFKVSDGEGLYAFVTAVGAISFRLAYRFDGKQKTLTFGLYPRTSLRQARQMKDIAKESLAKGIDPGVLSQISTQDKTTFRTVAERWSEIQHHRLDRRYFKILCNRLEADVYPEIGDKAIDTITAPQLVAMLRKIETRGAFETARRVHQMVRAIFRIAIGEGLLSSDPTAAVGQALSPARPKKRMASVEIVDLPDMLARINAYHGDPVTQLGLRMIVHTFVRTKELRLAEWSEFSDLDGPNAIWTIPASKMKMRRDHIVPLTPQVVALLNELRKLNGRFKHVFRGPMAQWDKPMSENTLLYALYRMGYHSRATVHGFRSTASTILNENEFNRDWIELQLAHVDASVRGVYNVALWLPQRRRMMEWWSNYLEPRGLFEDVL
jgi:integrase